MNAAAAIAASSPVVTRSMLLLRDAMRSTEAELVEATTAQLNAAWRAAQKDCRNLKRTKRLPLPSTELERLNAVRVLEEARTNRARSRATECREQADALDRPAGTLRRLFRLIVPEDAQAKASREQKVAQLRAEAVRFSSRANIAGLKVKTADEDITKARVAHRIAEENAHARAVEALEQRMIDLSEGITMVRADPSIALDVRENLADALARWRSEMSGDDPGLKPS